MSENNRSNSIRGILQEEQNLLSSVQDLLHTHNNERSDTLLDLLQAHSSKKESYNLIDVLELTSKSVLEKIWTSTSQVVETIASEQSYLIQAPTEEVDVDMLSVEESLLLDEQNRTLLIAAQETAQGSLNVLRAISSLILVAVSKTSKDSDLIISVERKPLPQMFETLQILHSMLFSIAAQSEEGEAVTVIIARCCEKWWTRNFPNKEELVTQLLPYLIASAMTETSTAADLKRLNGVRHALELLDFDHPSAETIKNLIVRCATTPLFLKRSKKNIQKQHRKNKKNHNQEDDDFIVDDDEDDLGENGENSKDEHDFAAESNSAMSEGQRILSYALNLNPNLTKEMWHAIKDELKGQTKATWSSYGTILFRAWKACDDQNVLDVIEENIIQNIMECGTKIADKSLFNACRTLLQSFTFNKRYDGVDEMLLRLYNPILWRSLNAANHHVRSQSTVLLIDAFPLQDPSSTNEIIDGILTKQFNILERLLMDNVPSVRIVTIEGVFRILAMYWDLIPTRFTKTVLSLVVDRLSNDASSTSVRISVINGLKYLVTTNVMSHGAMKVLLPRLSMHLHDKSPRVRQSFLDLLLAIRDIKRIPFFTIAPLTHLHARLIEDSKKDALCFRMVELLVPTYYPQTERSSVQLERASTMLMSYPTTALVFFEKLHLVIAVERVCKLILLFKRVLAVEILKLEQLEEKLEEIDAMHAMHEKKDRNETENEEEEEEDTTVHVRRKRARGDTTNSESMESILIEIEEATVESLRDVRLLVIAMRILWGSVHDELVLEEYEACNEQMTSEFALKGTKQFGFDSDMTYFERVLNVERIDDDTTCRSEIFCLCGYLPKEAVGDLKEEMYPMLYSHRLGVSGNSSITKEEGSAASDDQNRYQDPKKEQCRKELESFERECIVRTLCNWNAGPQLVALATKSLKAHLSGHPKRKKNNTTKNKISSEAKEVALRQKRAREEEEEEEDEEDEEEEGNSNGTNGEGEKEAETLMPLPSAIRVLEDTIAGNVADIRSNILLNRKWFTNLLRVTYGAKIQLDARLRERPGVLALTSSEIVSSDLCRILGLHCKLVVHGCALELIQEEKIENLEKDLYFPSPLMKIVGWATESIFKCHSNTTNTLGSMSRMSTMSGVSVGSIGSIGSLGSAASMPMSNRLSGVGLHSIGSSPLQTGPRSRRRRSVGGNPRRLSGGTNNAHSSWRTKYTQLSRDVAVVVTGIVADCALLGFKDRANFIVSNVDMWENAFKNMLKEGGENALLKEEMKKLVKWCKKMKGKEMKDKNPDSKNGSATPTKKNTMQQMEQKQVKHRQDEEEEEVDEDEEEEEEEEEDPFAEFERELELSRNSEEFATVLDELNDTMEEDVCNLENSIISSGKESSFVTNASSLTNESISTNSNMTMDEEDDDL